MLGLITLIQAFFGICLLILKKKGTALETILVIGGEADQSRAHPSRGYQNPCAPQCHINRF